MHCTGPATVDILFKVLLNKSILRVLKRAFNRTRFIFHCVFFSFHSHTPYRMQRKQTQFGYWFILAFECFIEYIASRIWYGVDRDDAIHLFVRIRLRPNGAVTSSQLKAVINPATECALASLNAHAFCARDSELLFVCLFLIWSIEGNTKTYKQYSHTHWGLQRNRMYMDVMLMFQFRY